MPVTAAPEHIGPYVLDRELGRGAHGVVWRAHHRDRPDTPVALKRVAGRGSLDRLLVEPSVLSRLDHPCIVGLEDYFVRGDDLVLALELVEGEDLQTLLDRGETFGPAEVRELLVQLGGALAEAHAKNVIHRDIKPSNILVVRKGGALRFVLTDFGIGQVAEGIQVHKHAGGTYFYMAPEQLRGRPCPQSDLWALGVVAYRLLTGRLPFEAASLADLSHHILYAAPPPPGQIAPQPPGPDLEAAVVRLLDKSLQERTASAEELLGQLGHRGSGDRVLTTRRRPRAAAAGLSLDRKLARGIFWRRLLIVACVALYILPSGLIAGVLVLAGMVLFARGQRDEREAPRFRAVATAAAFLLLGGANAWRYLVPQSAPPAAAPSTALRPAVAELGKFFGPEYAFLFGIFILVFAVVFTILIIFLPVIAGALYATLRRLERERVLREAALQDKENPDGYLEALRESVDRRFEDVGLHLKYAEALYGRGRVLEAAVEARLLLRQDPYHFNGNLLLANAYHALGLAEECAVLCDRYLEVSGYCFEFSELREQCRRGAGRP